MECSNKARKRCLNQFVKYDSDIGSLHAYKTILLGRKNAVDKEYVTIKVCSVSWRYFFYFEQNFKNWNFLLTQTILYACDDLQGQLIAQRNLHKRLKEEKQLNAKKVFLAKMKYFYRNRAARIIQRNWKLYCMRMSWKKKKGKKWREKK